MHSKLSVAHQTSYGLPLAYHFTFGTYGTRLHGDERPTVDARHNVYGTPFIESDPERCDEERETMTGDPVVLTQEQQHHVESTIPSICERGGWEHHVCAAGPDHVHVLLSTERDPYRVRTWLKTWAGQALSSRWPLLSSPRWWVKGGSVKHVWDKQYFDEAFEYIERQRSDRDRES